MRFFILFTSMIAASSAFLFPSAGGGGGGCGCRISR
ncbi:FIP (Fungus-Induced Protein) Related [Caenorhabditis elegans]|uniref:FIP (Fungus-Induced Protein) Related n=1 Tax=Caenorhabditis elegans TaxID=6239 RepID=A0A7R9XNC6_CAEEL|nr:FIP (Fungus-Induced Protein) Related [Caenorhabditis elegans]CAD8108835.1 FIP (Fungus-Induced Protein) Related [Caenorhabditis elegans]